MPRRVLLSVARRMTVAVLATIFASTGAAMARAMNENLDTFRWQKRPIVIFAPDAGDPDARKQSRLFFQENTCADERDMVLIQVLGPHVFVDGEADGARDAVGLRNRFRVDPGETAFLLIGKDGGVKIRSQTPLSADTLFGTIDAMPMRQREARERAGSGNSGNRAAC